jgi:hypothetical protein
MVIGTTSEVAFLNSIGIGEAFSFAYRVPTLKTEDAKKVKTLFSCYYIFVLDIYCGCGVPIWLSVAGEHQLSINDNKLNNKEVL